MHGLREWHHAIKGSRTGLVHIHWHKLNFEVILHRQTKIVRLSVCSIRVLQCCYTLDEAIVSGQPNLDRYFLFSLFAQHFHRGCHGVNMEETVYVIRVGGGGGGKGFNNGVLPSEER